MKWRSAANFNDNELAGEDLIIVLKDVVSVGQMTAMIEDEVMMIVWMPMMTVRYAVYEQWRSRKPLSRLSGKQGLPSKPLCACRYQLYFTYILPHYNIIVCTNYHPAQYLSRLPSLSSVSMLLSCPLFINAYKCS